MKRRRSSSPESRSTRHGSSGAEFEVFLSFRGPDTRATFADFLYLALLDKGVRVFIDKKEIDVGEEIGQEIFQAIDHSKICIPIFSRGYASSSWCLRELEHMMERRKTSELEVMPIFYDVEPSDVKLETGVYRDALTLHEEKRGAEIVQRWATALKEVTGIMGWDTKNTGHGELAHSIARKVLVKLKSSCVHMFDHLVGIDKSVNEVVDLLNVESQDIRLVGIWGMGGIGKTTLAKVVYHNVSTKFESCSFISNVREASKGSGLLNVQRQLVSDIIGDVGVELSSIDHGMNMIKDRFDRKKVLIFLDDVDHRSQLITLAAKAQWFGAGSRIVVTTRDKSVLSEFQDQFEHCLIYEAKGLNNPKALQLFSKHAFRSNSPPNAFLSLSKEVTAKTGGLPLAIEVIGSFLHGKREALWQDTLKKMGHCQHKDVKEKLLLSYEALDHHQQQIFLDIACLGRHFFPFGQYKTYAKYMWEDCGFFPDEGIEVLLLMSLVKIRGDDKLWMHDQLKDLGRSIVYKENCEDPRKGSRVWKRKGSEIVNNRKGTETVAAVCTKQWVCRQDSVLAPEDFINVPNIRYLDMGGGTLSGDFENLFLELRWLSWRWCPQDMQATNFCPRNLVILNLAFNSIDEHWGGWTQLKVATRLKVLNLICSQRLEETPDLSAYLSLEILTLHGCERLLRIHRSIGHLKRLKHLNLYGCKNLQVLPVELGSLEALTELLIANYDLSGSISQVPSSIGALANLERLVITGAIKLKTLPDSIGMLKGLVELDVSGTGIAELPNAVVNLKSLKVLKMSRSHMQKLPEAIGMLEKLEKIYGADCTRLEIIPSDIVRLPFLKILTLTKTQVENVPELPQSMVSLCLSSSATEKAPEISNLVNLRNLELYFTSSKSKDFPSARNYSHTYCMLKLPRITCISSYLGCLCCLEELELKNCENLCHIGQLPSGLRKLTVDGGNLLEVVDLSNLSNFKNLKDLTVRDCPKLVEVQGLDRVESLESLYIERCSSLRLPDLSNWKKLKEWDVDAPTVYSARGKKVARSDDLRFWHLQKKACRISKSFLC
ncbi:disease resistance protein L6-like [Rhodamnia argentea]|uniref:Disease resistance protein L6-like n=1 Tax=Rhodamnia argentea TaxID=178133 RepID=A0A8B8PIV7_9MYRT|nr:disease resistance protein L6-like [Rhodamnia argentea]XP_030534094.2 disease resistance protein L6-like [Rhodamnia argentea]XP_030534096.2 disease resistance protein L6-like [Rhodamnia argentea]XP_048134132.1 disease resistance protein L6-like [Rhodamnia argentea]